MKRPCPNCNSPQSFKPRQREEDGIVHVFIRCTMCRWEQDLMTGTAEQVKLRKDIDKLRGKAMRGDPVDYVLRKRQDRLRDTL